MELEMEQYICTIISSAGEARSLCFEGLQAARKRDFIKAEACMDQAKEALARTHQMHSDIIQREAGGEKQEVSLLLVHAEDHLMNTLLTKDLIKEMIEMVKMMPEQTKEE